MFFYTLESFATYAIGQRANNIHCNPLRRGCDDGKGMRGLFLQNSLALQMPAVCSVQLSSIPVQHWPVESTEDSLGCPGFAHMSD